MDDWGLFGLVRRIEEEGRELDDMTLRVKGKDKK